MGKQDRTSLLKGKMLDDPTDVPCVHTHQFEVLVLETMLRALEEAAEDPRMEGQSEVTKQLGDAMYQWTVDELMKFGAVGLYHLWEKHAKELLGANGINRSQMNAQAHGADSAERMMNILANKLKAPPEQVARDAVHEARKLANAIKHDAGDGYEKLERGYPKYFRSGTNDASKRFCIEREHLRDLIQRVAHFWETLPVDIDFSRL